MEYLVTMDGAGRIVIPKGVRRALSLYGGARLRILPREKGVLPEPIDEKPLVVREHGIPVFHVGVVDAIDHRELREERNQELVDRVMRRTPK